MNTSNSDRKNRNHADRTPEGRENRLISMALDLAEERLRNGTATAQEVVHFLKLGSEKSRVEVEKLELEKKLVEAKTENLKAQRDMATMFNDAMAAMKRYRGEEDDIDDYDDEDVYRADHIQHL